MNRRQALRVLSLASASPSLIAAWNEVEKLDHGPYSLGVVWLAGDRDDSAFCVIGRFGVKELLTRDYHDTTKITGETLRLMKKWNIDGANVAFRSGGGGKQIADQLRAMGHPVRDYYFGAVAMEKRKYFNRRAELYGRARIYLGQERWKNSEGKRPEEGEICGFAIPPDAKLRADALVLAISARVVD